MNLILVAIVITHLGSAPLFGPIHSTPDLIRDMSTPRYLEAYEALGSPPMGYEAGQLRYGQIPRHLDAMTEYVGGVKVLHNVILEGTHYGWYIGFQDGTLYIPAECGNVAWVDGHHQPTIPVLSLTVVPAARLTPEPQIATPEPTAAPTATSTPIPSGGHKCVICFGLLLLPLLFVHGGGDNSPPPPVHHAPTASPTPAPTPTPSPATPCPTPTPTKTPCPTPTPCPTKSS